MSVVPVVTFVIGFAGGAALGDLVRHLLRRPGGHTETLMNTILGVAILTAIGYTVFSTWAATAELHRVADCQRARNTEFAEAIAVRADTTEANIRANDRYIASQQRFLQTIISPDTPASELRAAYEDYLAALDEARSTNAELLRVRETHPVPQPIRCEP